LIFFFQTVFPPPPKKNPQISNFVNIRPVGAEMFPVGGQTERQDRHDEAK
jgi:hypothetical protein